jgi:phage terminase small subunit
MAADLSDKHKRFVEEYLIDLNATQAAIRAGYSAKTAHSQGPRLLEHVGVAAAIAAGQAARSKRTEITADRVLQELAKIGFSDIRRAVRWASQPVETDLEPDEELEAQPHGGALKRSRLSGVNVVELVGSDEIDDDTAAAISEVSQTTAGLKIKLHDKKGALVDIGRHLGMFTDKVEHTGANGGPIQSEMRAAVDLSGLTADQLRALASIKLPSEA